MSYEDLLKEADAAGLIVKEKPLPLSDGRIKGHKIAIRKNIPTLRKKQMYWRKNLVTTTPP